LTGNGRAFCVGADYQSVDEPGFTTTPVETPVYHQVWKPVICAINGHALGRGLGLALDCDIRVASEGAEFGCPEPKFGTITPVDIFEPYLPRGMAYELLLTGDRITARRAYEIGLVNKIVPQEEVLNEAMKIAERLCENAPLAVRGIKEMLSKNRGLTPSEAEALFETVKTRIRRSEDRKEGMKAFREKRKPRWQAK
jgi:enoyl-CoA hydratase/carnithine racemase